MHRFLFILLLVTMQPIFCGGILSCLWQGQDQQDDSADDEEETSNISQYISGVSCSCNNTRRVARFMIDYTYCFNGVSTKHSFGWEDSQTTENNYRAIERKLVQVDDVREKAVIEIVLAEFRESYPKLFGK
jgi:hypothetical protein